MATAMCLKRATQTSGAQSRHEAISEQSSLENKDKNPDCVSTDSVVEKQNVEMLRTVSKVPGNPNYYKKNGLRTYGDGEDHEREHPVSVAWQIHVVDGADCDQMTLKRFLVFVALSFLWTGSQIPLYLYGGIIPIIMGEIGGADRYVWILLGNVIPLATITPFVGALSDLFGRRNLAMAFSVVLIIGNVVCATAHTMNIFISGQVLCGIGAGVLELTALAATGELAPTSKRGLYVGTILITIVPYSLSVLYAQEIAAHGSWRWIGLWLGLWSLTGLVLIALFYWPPPRVNSSGLSRMEVLKRIDYIGGLLSCAGLTVFLAGLTWAGNQYTWHSTHVLTCIILGPILFGMFIVWEMYFVKYPMFPSRLNQNPRAFIVILLITFVSGANFFAVLVFWPSQYFFMYAGNDPVSVGVGSLPVGLCIIGGSIIVAILVSVLKGKMRTLMVISCIIMTAGTGAMSVANLTNLKYVYIAVTFACLGVGAVIIPNQIIISIVCPDDLIATATALTIAVRVVGGAIGYAIYYNILRQRFTVYATQYIGLAAIEAGVTSYQEIYNIAVAIGANLKSELYSFDHIDTVEKYNSLVEAGRICFSLSFPQMYYSSIAFGGIAIIAACFLPDLGQFMDDHIAVAYR